MVLAGTTTAHPITKEKIKGIVHESFQRRPTSNRPAKSNKSDYLSETKESKNRGSPGPLMTAIEFGFGVTSLMT